MSSIGTGGVPPLRDPVNGVRAPTPPQFFRNTRRRPTTTDWQNYDLGTFWLYAPAGNNALQEVWQLVSLEGNIGKWVLLSTGLGTVTSLRADDGNLANPNAGVVNVYGAGVITTTADNANTLTVNIAGSVANSFPTNAGTATPAAGVLNILGAHGINTAGASNTVTVAINNAITLGDLANITGGNDALTIATGDISLDATNGVGNINTLQANNTGNFGVYNSGGVPLMHINGVASLYIGPLSGGFNLTAGNQFNTCVGARTGQELTSGMQNTALGYHALLDATTATDNTVVGFLSGENITTSSLNTAVGRATLRSLTTGSGHNVAVGDEAANFLTTGSYNTALGYVAGTNWTSSESSNIAIENGGVTGESNTMRIGVTGSGVSQINRSFIAGIRGTTTDVNDAIPVLIDSLGQLGTVSSTRTVKEDIKDLTGSERIYNLRTVTFKYKNQPKDKDNVGLIAEEVMETMPEMVVYRNDGSPLTVKYHDLPVLLLKEIQKLNERINALENKTH